MTATEPALPGTMYLAPTKRTAFYDYYQRQYAQTLAWLQQALTTAATTTAGAVQRRRAVLWVGNPG